MSAAAVAPPPSAEAAFGRPGRGRWLAFLGALWTALAVLDPVAAIPSWPGLALALGGMLERARRRGHDHWTPFFALLSAVYTIDAQVTPNLGADSRSYFVWLPSVLFGRGVDFGEAFEALGLSLPPGSPVLRGLHPIGPALVWSPFYLAAHAYVVVGRALGRVAYAADGVSLPYLRAATLGTGVIAAFGMVALFRALRTRHDAPVAAVATAAIVLGSSVPYYLAVQPAMAHALVFGLAAILVWAWVETERAPTTGHWIGLGAAFGVLVLTRWQAAVAGVLPAALAVRDLRQGRGGRGPLLAAGVALLLLLPQSLAWRAQHGAWVTMPQGTGYVDWSSPHLLDVLLSADHGLFAWTPVAVLGALGLVGGWRRWGWLAPGGLAVLGVTAWVNGGVSDWAGSDAYGARRFDLVLPLLAVGVAVTVEWAATMVARRPLLAPAALLAFLGAWNLGLTRLHTRGAFPEAAPLERVAAAEAGLLRRGVEQALGAVFGARGRNLAYRFFVGEYLYVNTLLGGTIAVGGDDARYLGPGWSGPRWHEGGPRFRWALYPRACLRIPLAGKATLKALVTARVPRRLETQAFTVFANGAPVGSGRLGPDWADVPFTLPAAALFPGENDVCFEFERGWGEEGQQVGAQVARVQLP